MTSLGFVPRLNFGVPHQDASNCLFASIPIADVRGLFEGGGGLGRGGALPNKCFQNKPLWEVHCFCHKVHLVVNLETQAGVSYLVKILQSQSIGFSW